MTVIGHPDWARAVTLADNPFVAMSANAVSGVENFPFFGEPALKYQSYQLQLQFLNGGSSATNYCNVIVRFYDNSGVHTTAHVMLEDEFDINVGSILTFITDRMHGADMSVTCTFPGGTCSVLWLMSNRPADRLRVIEGPLGRDRILVQAQSIVVAASTLSAHIPIPSFHGPVEISLDTGPGNHIRWRFYHGSLANYYELVDLTTATTVLDRLFPLRAVHFTIDNLTAAQATTRIAVWARDA